MKKIVSISLICISLVMCQSAFAISPIAIAFFKSLAVPGWGELTNDNKIGYIFIASEISFWTAHFIYNNESKLKETAYYEYALKYAHIRQDSYAEQYYDDLAHYNSSYEYNDFNDNQYSEENAWNWDSRDNRTQFGVLRTQSIDYDDKAKIMIGAILLNHFISAINSARIANAKHKSKLSIQVDFIKDLTPILKAEYKF